MRNLDQLNERKRWYEDSIREMEAADAQFPDDPIHTNDIHQFRAALSVVERRITAIVGSK